MITLVPESSGSLLEGDPAIGSVDAVLAMRSFAHRVAEQAASYRLRAARASVELGRLSSEASDGARHKVDRTLLPGAMTLSRSAARTGDALGRYAGECARIGQEARRLREEVEAALETIRMQSTWIESISAAIGVRVSYAWDSAPAAQMPEPRPPQSTAALTAEQRMAEIQGLIVQHQTSWFNAALVWRDAVARVEAARRSWAALIEDRLDAEHRLRAALEETTIGQLISLAASVSPARTIALAFAGEFRGEAPSGIRPATRHPLLLKLIGRVDGGDVWSNPGDPAVIAARWAGLTAEERAALIAEVPAVIGNIPGLPFHVRDLANRNQIEFYRQNSHLLLPDELRLLAEIQRIVSRAEQQSPPDPPVQLLALQLGVDVPMAAVAYGDLDTSSYSTWLVPGMDSDAVEGLEGLDRSSLNLRFAQQLATASLNFPSTIVAWLGYDTPNLIGVLNSDSAIVGAARLAAELDGEYAARIALQQDFPVRNVLAHSYGANTAAIALTQIRHPVDTFTMIGPAGVDTTLVESLDALAVREISPEQQAIYVAHAESDGLAAFGTGASGRGGFSPDAHDLPGLYRWSAMYGGALLFPVEGDPERGLLATQDHSMLSGKGNGYMDRGTQALAGIARITTGRIDRELTESLRRTEASHVELDINPLTNAPVPIRREGDR